MYTLGGHLCIHTKERLSLVICLFSLSMYYSLSRPLWALERARYNNGDRTHRDFGTRRILYIEKERDREIDRDREGERERVQKQKKNESNLFSMMLLRDNPSRTGTHNHYHTN